MADQEINTGDVVRLKSGGPKMTAYWSMDGWFDCGWFDSENVYHREKFPWEALTLVVEEEGSDQPKKSLSVADNS